MIISHYHIFNRLYVLQMIFLLVCFKLNILGEYLEADVALDDDEAGVGGGLHYLDGRVHGLILDGGDHAVDGLYALDEDGRGGGRGGRQHRGHWPRHGGGEARGESARGPRHGPGGSLCPLSLWRRL